MISGSTTAISYLVADQGLMIGRNANPMDPTAGQTSAYGSVTFNAGYSSTGNEFLIPSSSNQLPNVLSVLPASGTLGIGTWAQETPCTLTVSGSVSMSVLYIGAQNDPGSNYYVTPQDRVIAVNTKAGQFGGIDSSLTLHLPTADNYVGMMLTVKDAGGFAGTNNIIISRTGQDWITTYGSTSFTINANGAAVTLISLGGMWCVISSHGID